MDVSWGIEPRTRGAGRHHLRGGVIVAGNGLGLAAVAPLQSEPRDARMALAWGLFFLVFDLVNIVFDVLVGRKEAARARELDERAVERVPRHEARPPRITREEAAPMWSRTARFVRTLLRWLGRIWLGLGAAAFALALSFLAIKIPYERLSEEPDFWSRTDLDDGPHMFWQEDGSARIVTVRGDRARRVLEARERHVAAEEARAELDRLGVLPAAVRPADEVPSTFRATRLVAISDVHGRLQRMAATLRAAGVVDGRLDWAYGSGHLVVAGDVFDKGPSVTASLWLLRKLERQAQGAGGRVHVLLGNHDFLALRGKSQTFGRKYELVGQAVGVSYAQLFGADTELGRWVRSLNVAVRINEDLFVHAGLSDAVLDHDLDLPRLNRLARAGLAAPSLMCLPPEERPAAATLWGRDGPASHRGYFDRSFPVGFVRAFRGDLRETASGALEIDRALRRYGCRRMLVGHTEAVSIRLLYGGRLAVLCQKLPSWDAAGPALTGEALILEGRSTTRVSLAGERTEL